MEKIGKILSVNISKKKGEKKYQVPQANVLLNGIENDAHSGDWHRQVSILSFEDIEKIKETMPDIAPGEFAENITTEGVDFSGVKIGDVIEIIPATDLNTSSEIIDKNIKTVVLQITQIGKECIKPCEIFKKVGYCIMPRSGIFCRVVRGGKITNGDKIKIIYND